MSAATDQPSIPERRLAERLRALREREYRSLTQGQLAKALGGEDPLSISTISLWEKAGSDRLPPAQRLAAYARLFCTHRSFAKGLHLLGDDELTEQEKERERELYEELLSLRDRAQSTSDVPSATAQRNSIWRFPERSTISIVCSKALEPPPHADVSHLNYSQYAKYVDLDALIEVVRRVEAYNQTSIIKIIPSEDLRGDFALGHVIIVGGATFREAGVLEWFADGIPLPPTRAIEETYAFDCTVGGETREFTSAVDGESLVQDVGLIARGPHPDIPGSTVTVLSGITSRGVHGAALCFADRHVREFNETYLEETFGNADAFCILMNVSVRNNVAVPPDLTKPKVRVYHWTSNTGAHW